MAPDTYSDASRKRIDANRRANQVRPPRCLLSLLWPGSPKPGIDPMPCSQLPGPSKLLPIPLVPRSRSSTAHKAKFISPARMSWKKFEIIGRSGFVPSRFASFVTSDRGLFRVRDQPPFSYPRTLPSFRSQVPHEPEGTSGA